MTILSLGLSLGAIALRGATSSPDAWVLTDENGDQALLDLDFDNDRYWYNGVLYSSIAALNAVCPITDNGDGTYTIGPAGNGQPFTGYNIAAGTLVIDWTSTSTTQGLFVYCIQASTATRWRRITADGSNRSAVDMTASSVNQAIFQSDTVPTKQINHRMRAVDVMAANDFSSHVNGELHGTDNSGTPGTAANTKMMLGHRDGSAKLIGTVRRVSYFPRAVSMEQRYLLSRQTPEVLVPGAWTFFNSPNAIKVGNDVWAGAMTCIMGNVVFGKKGSAPVTLAQATFQGDDHNNPRPLRRSLDGRIIAAYCWHSVSDNLYIKISTNPDDMTSWGDAVDIGASIGGQQFTYSALVEIEDGIFLFTRCQTSGTYNTWHYTKSTDGGVTWSALTQLFDEPDQRSYSQFCKGGANRIDCICNDGHPNEYTGNSTYHLYYQDGAWYKTDGTALGAAPFRPKDELTRIWNGTGGVESWVWDIQWDGQNLAAVFATFPTPLTDHRYQYARLIGTTWSVHEICTGGGAVDPTGGTIDETFYSGGVSVDPDDVSIVYCSRETGSGGPGHNGGFFNIWRGVTADLGVSFTLTQLTSMSGVNSAFRPHKVAGSNTLAFVQGEYTDYRNYQTAIVSIAA